MISRWELGNLPSDLKYLYVDYTGTGRKFNEEKNPPSKSSLETLQLNFGYKPSSLKLLHVRSCSEVEHIYCPDKGRRERYERNSGNHVSGILHYESICLKVIPDTIGNLSNLRELDLSDNNLETLPESIGRLYNLEELYLSGNRNFRRLPYSIGDLKNLETLELEQTNLESLPESMGKLTKLSSFVISKFTEGYGPRGNPYYKTEGYSSDWYYRVVEQSLSHWSLPPLGVDKSSLDWSNKNLTQFPCCPSILAGLKELDVSSNQLTEIPLLLRKLKLKKLDIHNNPKLNHLPDFLWYMGLKELKIDKKFIKDLHLQKYAKISLTDKKLVKKVIVELILAGKNNKKMSDKDLLEIIAMSNDFILETIGMGPIFVHLK